MTDPRLATILDSLAREPAMTPEQALALGKRAVASPRWRWPDDGMLPGLVAGGDDPRYQQGLRVVVYVDHIPCVPDLRDPRAVGWLLALVREAWRDPSLALAPVDESIPVRWSWADDGLAAPLAHLPVGYDEFASEAEGLVAALEAAP
jgi:hypothetical protein